MSPCRFLFKSRGYTDLGINRLETAMDHLTDKNKIELLRQLADYRMLTFTQISVLSSKSPRTARRRMKELVDQGLAEILPVSFSQGQGRPESVFGISQKGLTALRSVGALPKSVEFNQVGGMALVHQAGHQILLNWCRLHLIHLTRTLPRLTSSFLSSNSPFDLDPDLKGPAIRDFVPVTEKAKPDEKCHFVPDGVFILTDSEETKSLLFFLEVDLGSEPLESSESGRTDISKKIQIYQSYIASEKYKRYEESWRVKLNGFRVLFVTSTSSRMASLCRVVQSIPPSGFIWVTSQESMFAEGISGTIWARGGKQDIARQSILADLCMKAPIPISAVS